MTAQLQVASRAFLGDYLVAHGDTAVLAEWAEEEFGLTASAPPGVKAYPALLVYDHANGVFFHHHGWLQDAKTPTAALKAVFEDMRAGRLPAQRVLTATWHSVLSKQVYAPPSPFPSTRNPTQVKS